jgi:TIR domain
MLLSVLSEEEHQVVQAFIDARLLTSSQREDMTMVQVAHPVLLRRWPPLREAIELARDSLRIRADLERWAREWDLAGRQDDYLLVGNRLAGAQLWAANHPELVSTSPVLKAFLESSVPTHRLKVFLCHSSTDKPAVRRLYDTLRAVNMRPWLDERDIRPGQDWDLEIRHAIRASDIILVCLSEGVATKKGYIQKEIRNVLDVADEQPEGTIFLIPVLLEPCEVPDRLNRWQWVKLFEEAGYRQLISTLQDQAAASS